MIKRSLTYAGQTLLVPDESIATTPPPPEQGPGDLLPITGINSQIENNISVTLPENGDFIVTIRPVMLPEGPQLAFDVTFAIP